MVLLVAQPWVGCRTLTACAPDIGGAIVHDSAVVEPLATVPALPGCTWALPLCILQGHRGLALECLGGVCIPYCGVCGLSVGAMPMGYCTDTRAAT